MPKHDKKRRLKRRVTKANGGVHPKTRRKQARSQVHPARLKSETG